MREIWFWHKIVSPHMAGLATALASLGHTVTYLATGEMTASRRALGWGVAELSGVRLRRLRDRRDAYLTGWHAPAGVVHICEGIRGNGWVASAQRALSRRGALQWIIMETVDDAGPVGLLKRWEYRRLFHGRRHSLSGVLATGHRTPGWVTARGFPSSLVYPFAYFLSPQRASEIAGSPAPESFRFLFVGQFIERKRLDVLVNALSSMGDTRFELRVVGAGPMEERLRTHAESALGARVRWIGRAEQGRVPEIMAQSDCLVLPSRHDGWGAVASESLMAGTPVVCSDGCGVAGVVRASGFGGVFDGRRPDELPPLLRTQLQAGPISQDNRKRLASWGQLALSAQAGARYLGAILERLPDAARPRPPWLDSRVRDC